MKITKTTVIILTCILILTVCVFAVGTGVKADVQADNYEPTRTPCKYPNHLFENYGDFFAAYEPYTSTQHHKCIYEPLACVDCGYRKDEFMWDEYEDHFGGTAEYIGYHYHANGMHYFMYRKTCVASGCGTVYYTLTGVSCPGNGNHVSAP